MIVRCSFCQKEFEKPSYRNQHEKDVHADQKQKKKEEIQRKVKFTVRYWSNGELK